MHSTHRKNVPGDLRSRTEVVERMRGHALFYMHDKEERPESAIGAWLWKVSDMIESDVKLNFPKEQRFPEQRRPKNNDTRG